MKRLLFVAAAAVSLAVAGPAAAAPFKGVVVAHDGSSLLVAGPGGVVRAVSGRAAVGSRVAVTGARVVTVGHASRALVRGIVVRRSAGLTFLSTAHHVLVLRSGRRLASLAGTAQPQPGDIVQAQVALSPGGALDATQTQQLGHASNVQIQAVVTSVGTGTVTLTVNGQPLTIPLPAGLTLPPSVVGTQVQLNVSFAGGQPTAQPGATSGDDEGDDEDDQGDDDNGSASGAQQGGGHEHGDAGDDD